jgi:chromosomal replication initiator protein
MLPTDRILWEGVLKSLSEKYKVTDVHINTWLKTAEVTGITSMEVSIKCPTKFHCTFVTENYLKNIQKILEEEFSINAKVTLFYDRTAPKEKAEEVKKTEVKPVKSVAGLDEKMTFERFVVGESNIFAYKASQTVAEGSFTRHNPLFIYGDVGLGKTHLMSAVGNHIRISFPKLKILFLESKQFVQEVVNLFALPKKERDGDATQERVISLRERYSEVDLFMLDDIQMMENTPKSLEIFFDIFNQLYKENKQIIITSDRTPQHLKIEDRLRSRFNGGLLVPIEPPSLEERVAILRKKADENNIIIEDEYAFYLSENIKVNDVRSLEGVLKSAALIASLDKAPISKEYILRALKDRELLKTADLFTSDSLINAVTEIFKIKQSELYSAKRTKNIAHVRQITMYLLREKLNLSLKEIGSIFGGKDHSTVSYAVKQVTEQLENDQHLQEVLVKITEKARER